MKKRLLLISLLCFASTAFAKPAPSKTINQLKCSVQQTLSEEQSQQQSNGDVIKVVEEFEIELESDSKNIYSGEAIVKLENPQREALIQAELDTSDGRRIVEMSFKDSDAVEVQASNVVIKDGKEIVTSFLNMDIKHEMTLTCLLKQTKPKDK